MMSLKQNQVKTTLLFVLLVSITDIATSSTISPGSLVFQTKSKSCSSYWGSLSGSPALVLSKQKDKKSSEHFYQLLGSDGDLVWVKLKSKKFVIPEISFLKEINTLDRIAWRDDPKTYDNLDQKQREFSIRSHDRGMLIGVSKETNYLTYPKNTGIWSVKKLPEPNPYIGPLLQIKVKDNTGWIGPSQLQLHWKSNKRINKKTNPVEIIKTYGLSGLVREPFVTVLNDHSQVFSPKKSVMNLEEISDKQWAKSTPALRTNWDTIETVIHCDTNNQADISTIVIHRSGASRAFSFFNAKGKQKTLVVESRAPQVESIEFKDMNGDGFNDWLLSLVSVGSHESIEALWLISGDSLNANFKIGHLFHIPDQKKPAKWTRQGLKYGVSWIK